MGGGLPSLACASERALSMASLPVRAPPSTDEAGGRLALERVPSGVEFGFMFWGSETERSDGNLLTPSPLS